MSEAVMREMIKFFDAVSGGTGPYGWIYAMEHEKYGIEFAKHQTRDGLGFNLEYLELRVYGKYLVICCRRDIDRFAINSLGYRTLYFETLDELFDHL